MKNIGIPLMDKFEEKYGKDVNVELRLVNFGGEIISTTGLLRKIDNLGVKILPMDIGPSQEREVNYGCPNCGIYQVLVNGNVIYNNSFCKEFYSQFDEHFSLSNPKEFQQDLFKKGIWTLDN